MTPCPRSPMPPRVRDLVGKHETGYARVERDDYPTPAWVIDALAEHIHLRGRIVWECACGEGRMAEALKAAGCARVYSTGIVNGYADQDGGVGFPLGADSRFAALRRNDNQSAFWPQREDSGGIHRERPAAAWGRLHEFRRAAATARFRFRQDARAPVRRLPVLHWQDHAEATREMVRAPRSSSAEAQSQGEHGLVSV